MSGRSGISLRQGLDRDVYQILKKLEDANDGKPFKNVTSVYEAIKKSNSSLSRQKKRPLEDSIERVLQFRKKELGDSEDSEAEIEEIEIARQEDDRFLLNKQMTKHWHQSTTTKMDSTTTVGTVRELDDMRASKKRRLQVEEQDKGGQSSGGEIMAGAVPPVNGTTTPLVEKSNKPLQKKVPKVSRYTVEEELKPVQLAGIDEIYGEIRRRVLHTLKEVEFYKRNKFHRVPGILLSGPLGSGKKSIVQSIAAEAEVPLITPKRDCLYDPERLEKCLTEAVDEAMRVAPCILFIPHLERHMSKPGGTGHNDLHQRVVGQFMDQMERIRRDQPYDRPVIAMATTSREADIDPAVLMLGFFEYTFQLKIPDLQAREAILKLATRDLRVSPDVNFAELAKSTHGFVGADIFHTVVLAERLVADRVLAEPPQSSAVPLIDYPDDSHDADEAHEDDPSTTLAVLTAQDLRQAIKSFTPSLRKEGFTVIPEVSWDQVGALEKAREQLHLSIIGPIKNPDLYRKYGLHRPAGVLLWGPPGCGKTLVAQAVAHDAQASFILINGPELLNKYVGESERAVRDLFQRARSSTPCILFFDEIDSLVPRRDNASTEAGTRVVNALLTELDGVGDRSGIYVIGTTNRPDMIDAAMLRPGRLSERLFVDLPTPDERVDILKAIYRTNNPERPASVDVLERLQAVAKDPRCTDFSGADLGGLYTKAAQTALLRHMNGSMDDFTMDEVISAEDWERALSTSTRSVANPEMYRKLQTKV
ncbi:hypothetical protein S7711_02075 [Stachybotrys chartarum IBT 7711]|uniref:Peroxisomal ATPase PEX1 n=1 Tax=Stachybotrys chartarum (strain CBS 109288 / IBT 7711) TaxID=1280523 RepID=A0A084AW61_STACB|nr:hypothetical protein S7711_02075 [Stachybotrys chartarum IBT 7711]